MPSATQSKFDEILQRLFEARIYDLRAKVWTARGAKPKVTRRRVGAAIEGLQSLAEDALLRQRKTKKIFVSYDHKKQWHPKRGKGFGRTAKKQNFKNWYDEEISTRNCVYIFWGKSTCLYVGRTLNGKGRPSSHFEKHWFGRATRVDVYGFDRKRDVPRFECMATHKYEPVYSKIKPASKKYYTVCPVCDVQHDIGLEIKDIFRLR